MAEAKEVDQPKAAQPSGLRTLAVDIGGTGIKVEILDEAGKPVTERLREPTPHPATPRAVVRTIRKLATAAGEYDRASVGFPGVVKRGRVYTAPNLGKGWKGLVLDKLLERKLRCPVRLENDADVQGLGSVTGRGIELVVTLGTGVGSVVFVDGTRLHLELGHAPFHKGKTYEEELGVRALKKKGKRKWNKLLREAIEDLAVTFNYDRLYLGGGNARHIKFDLPKNVKIVSNEEGLLGGIRLWQEGPTSSALPSRRAPAVRGRHPRATAVRASSDGPAPP